MIKAFLISAALLLSAFTMSQDRFEQDLFETVELIEKWIGESEVSYQMSNKTYAIDQEFSVVEGSGFPSEYLLKEVTTKDGEPYQVEETIFRFVDISKIVDEGYKSYKGMFLYYSFRVDFQENHHCKKMVQKHGQETENITKSFVRIKCDNSQTYELLKTKFEEAHTLST